MMSNDRATHGILFGKPGPRERSPEKHNQQTYSPCSHGSAWRMAAIGLIMLVLLSGCAGGETDAGAPPAKVRTTVDLNAVTLVDGQLLYVPAYSEIYYADQERTWDFAITLAVHNADPARPIIVESLAYYNGDGLWVHDYVAQPFLLPPLATHAVTVPRDDKSGGVGANFLVKWTAEDAVVDPVVEAVMISAAGQQGLSFITTSRIIEELGAP